jgi:hypothetical protein
MAYGDTDPRNTAGLDAIHAGFWQTLAAAASQRPLIIGGHFPSGNGNPTTPNNTDSTTSSIFNINTDYLWNSGGGDQIAYSYVLAGSQQTGGAGTVPTLAFDSAMYENDPFFSGDKSANGVRKRWWWSLLSGTAGVFWGNELCSNAGSLAGAMGTFTFANANVAAGFLSDGHAQLAVDTAIWRSVAWQTLLPEGTGAVGTLISAGHGTNGGQDWVVAAADPSGGALVAYIPTAHSGTLGVNMAAMGGTTDATWVDPTSGTSSSAGTGLPNSGTHVFTPPGTNAYGQNDWVLILRD